jgi:hypothetical protein
MARMKNNAIINGLSGQVGKQLVFKKYGNKTIVTKYPDMGGIKASQLQEVKRNKFKEAVAYAQSILRDKTKKAAYQKKLPKGKSVYHAAIQEYLKKN